jgi:hypothetical protein
LLSTQGETRLDPGHRFQSGSTLLDGIDTNPFQAVLEDQAKSQPAPEAQMANADGVCYTMRMYKVKATERLAGGESASRGYSTCELARNYQIRSAVLHEQTVEAPKAQSQQK